MNIILALTALVSATAADVDWHDARDLGVRGRGFAADELESFADRLPQVAKNHVREEIWNLSTQSAGLYVDFYTDSEELHLNRTYIYDEFSRYHFASTGFAGMDLFLWDSGNATWRWSGTTTQQSQIVEVGSIEALGSGLRKFRLHFPLYNGLQSLMIGVTPGSKIYGAEYNYNQTGPVLWYGTSITQGAAVSRPGFAFTNHIRRNIQNEVYNFGFAGNCLMEKDVAQYLVQVKPTPSVFVIDCEWNMVGPEIAERATPLVQQVRAALPGVPIVLAEATISGSAWASSSANATQNLRWQALRETYQNLTKSGFTDLHYVEAGDLFNFTNDPHKLLSPTVGGTHPSDLGDTSITAYYSRFLPTIIKKQPQEVVYPEFVGGQSLFRDLTYADGLKNESQRREPAAPKGTVFFDVEELGIMNRPFNDTERYYNRLPKSASSKVRQPVWQLSQYNTGMAVHFITDSPNVYINYTLINPVVPLWHMPSTGVSGADLFRYDEEHNVFRFIDCVKEWFSPGQWNSQILGTDMPAGPGRYIIYLPLRNEVGKAYIGVNPGHTVTRDPAFSRDSITANNKKPILWYGTSIDQGGVAPRPGATYTNILSRNLGRQVLNYGFAGNGKMETNVMDYMAQIDVALFVIDCNPNMNAETITNNTIPLYNFIRNFNGTDHSKTPILFVGGTDYGSYWINPASNNNKRAALKKQIDAIQANKPDPNLHLFLNAHNELFNGDYLTNPTVGGTHPSDMGHREIANFYTSYLPQFLS